MIARATTVRKVSRGRSVDEYGSETETGEFGFVMSAERKWTSPTLRIPCHYLCLRTRRDLPGYIAHSGLPWAEARNQSRDVTAIIHVGISESMSEAGLLKQRDIDRVRREKDESPDEMGPREKSEGLPKKHKYNAGYHWIPDVAIWSAYHETARRIPGSERAFSFRHEIPQRRRKKNQADR